MTGFGVLVGLWLIALSIDRMTDKVCEMLKSIQINVGKIRIVRDDEEEKP